MTVFSKFSKSYPLLLLGNGKMGSSLLAGWIKAGLDPTSVLIVDPFNGHEDIKSYKSILNLPKNLSVKILVLAVKPQILPTVIKECADIGLKAQSILSIAAGFKVSKLEEIFGTDVPILRAMPNTPVSIGKGISGIFGNSASTILEMELAKNLLSTCGLVVEVEKESLIDAVTSVSGSGPAYVFYMVEAMAKGGEAQGLSTEVAYQLAKETIIGAGALLDMSDEDARTLRKNVTSPMGTTEAALNILMEDSALVKLMKKAIKAAYDRGVELSER